MTPPIKTLVPGALACLVALGGCATDGARDGAPAPQPRIVSIAQVPPAHRPGRAVFVQLCAGCHGEWASGTASGPPLIHDLYKPGHHSDRAFASAIHNGTREHHWYFGDMPAVTAASPTDIGQIVAFLRWLQKAEDMYY